jgi:hypothetical protein
MDIAGIRAIQPKVISSIWIEQEQGQYLCGAMLPEERVPQREFTYHYFGRITGMTPRVFDGAEFEKYNENYIEKLGTCHEYGESAVITDKAIRYTQGVRSLIQDYRNSLIKRLLMRQEFQFISAITDTGTGDTQIPSDTHTRDMSGVGEKRQWNDERAQILNDLGYAQTVIRKEAKVTPDTIIMSPDVFNVFRNSIDLRLWQYAGPFSQQIIEQGAVGKVYGMDIFVSNVSYQPTEDDPDSTVTTMLSDYVVIMKRGEFIGKNFVSEAQQAKMVRNEQRRGIELMLWKEFAPIIYRPYGIFVYSDVLADAIS